MSAVATAVRAVGRGGDRTPRDWLEAGQDLLKRGGLKALKLRPLAAELDVSTGSFYHHFRDFDRYQAALTEYFAGDQIDTLLAAMERGHDQPLARIRGLAIHVRRYGMSRLSLAMRAWAESDPRAAEAVRLHDEKVTAFLAHCLGTAGFERGEARIRAHALLAVGIGNVAPPVDMAPEAWREGMLALLCER